MMAKIDIDNTVVEIADNALYKIQNSLLMPNCCWTCKHDVTYRWKVGRRIDEDICMLTGKTILMDDEPWEKRMDWCPLRLESEEG